MRSSGRTTVSRTSARIDSVRRRRRGRRAGAIASIAGSVIAFVVIALSVKKRPGALGRTEPPAGGAVRAVRAERLAAGEAPLQQRILLGHAATGTLPPLDVGHSRSARRRNFPRREPLSISSGPVRPAALAAQGSANSVVQFASVIPHPMAV